jgi:hypothetical protein
MRKFIFSALQRVADRSSPSGYAARDVQPCSIVATGTLTAAPRSLAVYAENPAVKDFAMRKFSSPEEIEDARPLVQLERQRLDQYVQLERQRLDQNTAPAGATWVGAHARPSRPQSRSTSSGARASDEQPRRTDEGGGRAPGSGAYGWQTACRRP